MGEQLRRIWQEMSPAQRLRLGAMLGVVALGTAALVAWALRPSYAILYTDLSPEDAAAITDYLREQRIPYRLGRGGSVIEVPQERVYELRIKTAGKGLIGSSTTGFELFDRSTLPGTDFANRVNLQRALQGELSKTIASLEEVSDARVHLVLPTDDLFGKSQPAEASVMVKLRGQLSAEQVRGIQMLVAHSVEGLKPEQVTIVDQYGNVLAGGGEGDMALTATQMEAKLKFEDELKRRLQQMMDAFVGPHKSVVEARVDMEFDREEIEEEQVTPASAGGQGMLKREEVTREDYRGSGGGVGGPAGTSSNVASGGPVALGGGGGQYSHVEETREYEFSRRIARVLKPPGKIKRIAVAVMVDESVAADIQSIRALIEAAMGADPARGDVVEVRRVALERAKIAEKSEKDAEKLAAAQRRGQLLSKLGRYVSGLALALVIGGFLLAASRQLRQAVAGSGRTTTGSAEQEGGGELPPGGSEAPRLPDRQPQEEARVLQDDLQAKIQSYAREHPEAFAAQLRRMMASGVHESSDENARALPDARRQRAADVGTQGPHSRSGGR
ncbi:MAG: flagellar M-ring protein FliF [Armatimonadetes bacterium]|nr:flagellar M-ring protein FliF [Armatimonadota bacterium]